MLFAKATVGVAVIIFLLASIVAVKGTSTPLASVSFNVKSEATFASVISESSILRIASSKVKTIGVLMATLISPLVGVAVKDGAVTSAVAAGVTADPRFTRITIVTSGDDEILDQIEKQVAKLIDIRDIRELKASESVFRELCLIKVETSTEERQAIVALTDIFRANIIDVAPDSLIIELTGDQDKIEAFISLLDGHNILELARTGIAGLSRGKENVIWIEE